MSNQRDEQFVEEVRLHNDIVSVIGSYVTLQKKGQRYWGLCPFHAEKSSSFSVSSDNQLFYCFGCQTGGNVFQFIMKQENLPFPEAVKFLANRAGLQIPERELSPEERQRRSERDELARINELATQYFRQSLVDGNGSEQARAYLRQRGLNDQTIARFRLGYAPDGWDGLLRVLRREGVPDQTAVRGGLAVAGENSVYDRFRDRLMFPIQDLRGRVIAFGGRILGEGQPKYLNSPESVLFHKGRCLYALPNAFDTIRKNHRVIVVEGYLDVITAHQHGVTNVVACLGTALTPEHARELRQINPEIVLCYDADQAGRTAAVRGIEVLERAGCLVKVMGIPKGKDPDEFIRNEGAEAFQTLVAGALPLNAFRLRLALGEGPEPVAQEGIETALRVLASIGDRLEQEGYIRSVAERLERSEEAVRIEVKRLVRQSPIRRVPDNSSPSRHTSRESMPVRRDTDVRQGVGTTGGTNAGAVGSLSGKRGLPPGHVAAEETLLRIALTNAEGAGAVWAKVTLDYFSTYEQLATVLRSSHLEYGWVEPSVLLNHLAEQPEDQAALMQILSRNIGPACGREEVDQQLSVLQRWRMEAEIRFLEKEIETAITSADSVRQRELTMRLSQILRDRKGFTPGAGSPGKGET